jgi:glucose-1-phosphate thymidylyltransferase
MRGIILHGGYGTRLRPLTHTGPKQLIPVANKPISQYVLEDLIEAGISQVTIVLGNMHPEKVREHYGNGDAFNAQISYVDQNEPGGIAQAVGLCEQQMQNQPFVVYLGDNLIKGGIKNCKELFETSKHDAMILLCEVDNPQIFGVAKFNEKRELIALIEKPKEPPSNYALTGIYFFKPVIFDMIRKIKPSWRGELEITEAIQLLLENGYDIGYEIVKGWWKDTGAPEDILEANRLVLDDLTPEIKGKIENDNSLQGRVSIGENTFVRQGALIRGPVILGEGATIESDVYIGPYTSIGNNVTIKKGEIENSIIMDNCVIDVKEKITDSLIAPYSKIISSDRNKPSGRRFILGERSHIEL